MLNGSLKTIPALDIIEVGKHKLAKGSITFTQGQNQKKIYFRKGLITSAGSNDPADYLGQYLISADIISFEQFIEAYKIELETNVKMADVLSIMGVASPKKIEEIIVRKICDTVFTVSLWDSGEFECSETYPEMKEQIAIGVSFKKLQKELKKRYEELDEIVKMFKDIGDFPEIRVNKPIAGLRSIERQILNVLALGKPIKNIAEMLPLHFYLLSRAMLKLYKEGILQSGHGVAMSRDEIIEKIRSPRYQSDSPDERHEPEIFELARSAYQNKDYLTASIYYRILSNINPSNIFFRDGLNAAEHSYVVYFYKSVFSPFAVLTTSHEFDGDFDVTELKVLEKIKEKECSLNEIVESFAPDFPETWILGLVERLKRKEIIQEKKPQNLIEAVKTGHMKEIAKFIKHGADINELAHFKDSLFAGMTPLMIAVKLGFFPVADFLIRKGATISSHIQSGNTLFHYSAISGNTKFIPFFFSKGVKINEKNRLGETPLIISAKDKTGEMPEILLKFGADIEARTNSGETALYFALQNNNLIMIRQLILAKTILINIDGKGNDALHFAQSEEAAELLLNGVDLFQEVGFALKAKYEALRFSESKSEKERHKNILELFENIRQKARIRKRAAMFLIFVICSVIFGFLSTIFITKIENRTKQKGELLKKEESFVVKEIPFEGRKKESAPDFYEPPLLKAVLENNISKVEELLDNNADINSGINGLTPLAAAVRMNLDAIASLLITRGANPNIVVEGEGKTPIFYALEKGDYRVANLLLSKGADINKEDRNGDTLFGYAINTLNPELFRYLILKKANILLLRRDDYSFLFKEKGTFAPDPEKIAQALEIYAENSKQLLVEITPDKKVDGCLRKIDFEELGVSIFLGNSANFKDYGVAENLNEKEALIKKELGLDQAAIKFNNTASTGRHIMVKSADGEKTSCVWIKKMSDKRLEASTLNHEKFHALKSLFPEGVIFLSRELRKEGYNLSLEFYDEELAASIVEIISLHKQGVTLDNLRLSPDDYLALAIVKNSLLK